MEKAKFYVLNSYLKFDKKIYHFFDYTLPRPVPLKGAVYFVLAMIPLMGLPLVPYIGWTIGWIPWIFRLGIAFFLAHLLSGTATENRNPIHFLQSFIRYHFRTPKGVTYYKGRELVTPPPVKFRGAPSIQNPNPEPPKPKGEKIKKLYTIGADGHERIDGISHKTH